MLPVARDMWNVNCTVYGSLPTPPLCLFLSPFLSLFLLSLTAVWTALTVVIPGPVARTRTRLVHTIAIAAPICLSRHPWGCPVCPPMILDSCPRMLSSPNRHPPCHQKHLTRYVQAWEQKPECELDSLTWLTFQKKDLMWFWGTLESVWTLRVRFVSVHFIYPKVGPLGGVIYAAFAVSTEERDESLLRDLVFPLALEGA